MTFDTIGYRSRASRFHRRQALSDQACVQIRQIVIDTPGVQYLEDSVTTVMGVSIYGSPWQPEFFDWAFNATRGASLRAIWQKIPAGVDVLMTHGPPLGHGDMCSHGERAGCLDLLRVIQQRVKPKYHIFGHIHEGYGVTSDGHTTYINASTCNLAYKPVQPPIVFDVVPGSPGANSGLVVTSAVDEPAIALAARAGSGP